MNRHKKKGMKSNLKREREREREGGVRRSRQPLIRAAPDAAEAPGCFCAKHIKDRANKLETKTNHLTARSVVEQTTAAGGAPLLSFSSAQTRSP